MAKVNRKKSRREINLNYECLKGDSIEEFLDSIRKLLNREIISKLDSNDDWDPVNFCFESVGGWDYDTPAIVIEFERPETEKEKAARLKRSKKAKEAAAKRKANQRERDLKQLQKLAKKHNVKVEVTSK